MPSLGIRRETKSVWERRVAVPPDLAATLVADGVEVVVERSERRIYNDAAYAEAGATLVDDLPDVDVVIGVKEIPVERFLPGRPHVFFAHVIKGQDYNMGMLGHLLSEGCTLVDYERITDEDGRRLVFFGRHAGLAGMIDALWALGARCAAEGIDTPFAALQPAHAYGSLDEAVAAVSSAGAHLAEHGVPEALHPLVFGITGDGNVSRGVSEILDALPVQDVAPDDLAALVDDPDAAPRDRVYRVVFREPDLVRPRDIRKPFDLAEYYDHPERYESVMAPHLRRLSVLMNGIYWTEDYPRVVRLQDLPAMKRCRVIGDISCDIGGSIEATVKATEPGDPVYTVDCGTGEETMGVTGEGPVICAVDILPAELPREASETFAAALAPYLPAMVSADWSQPLEALDLPAPIRRAIIAHRGELVPEYAWLADEVAKAGGSGEAA